MGSVHNLIWQGVLLPVTRVHPEHVCAGKQVLSFKEEKKSESKQNISSLDATAQRYQG